MNDFNWINDKLKDLEVYVLPDDIRLYQKYVYPLEKGSKIMDLGTGWGKSVLAMALSNPGVDIWTIDTSEHPIANNFARDQFDYIKNIIERFRSYGVFNIYPILNNVMGIEVPIRYFDVLSVDLHLDMEQQGLQQWYPSVKHGGIIFARNHIRYPKLAAELFKRDTLLDEAGEIRVYKKL